MRLRKEFLYHIEAKIDAAIEITTHLQMQTILFGQSIKGADKINEQLGDKCVEYHSKITAKTLKENLSSIYQSKDRSVFMCSCNYFMS